MKRIIAALMVSTILLGGVYAQAGEKIAIGFSNRTLNGPYFQALTTHMENLGRAAGYEVIATDARGDYSKQQSDCEDLISQNIKYLVLNPQDPDAGIRIARQADREGIKVITIDSDISLEAPVVTRILPDNGGNNLAIGRYAADVAGDEPLK
ncbi:MAG: substrate-binding domain-containing protein, partial [Planctomycetaceae bacterium]|nr:substrate-binding domain-containing protein [Planctomycetaceae bacterium]